MVKAYELRKKNKEELLKELDQLKSNLFELRISKATQGNTNTLLGMKKLRKSIARVNTVLTEKQRNEVRKLYSKSKYLPLDLREKHTRAYRRRLKPVHLRQKLLKLKKKEQNFPQRRFAVVA
jgi:large subunit ribosomal protein L35e